MSEAKKAAGAEVVSDVWPSKPRRAPLSVTHEALLVEGSDRAFRGLIQDLLVMAKQLQGLRLALARELGVSEPQYRLVLAIAQLEEKDGVGVNQVANYLRVTGAFVTMEARKLVRRGFVAKKSDRRDGRAVLLCLTVKGRRALGELAPRQQAVNDELFRGFSASEFNALASLGRRLVANGERARSIGEALARPTAASGASDRRSSARLDRRAR